VSKKVAASYERKSTSQHGVAEDDKSNTRQRSSNNSLIDLHAREWVFGPTFSDEGISGGTFARPGFQKMKAAATAGEFQMLVIFDLDRYSRADEVETMNELRELARLGVEVWDSGSRRRIELEDTGGLVTYVNAHAAKQYRLQIAKHTKDALHFKASKGRPVTAPPYGYKSVIVLPDGTLIDAPPRSQREKGVVLRHVRDPETSPVVLMGEWFASGLGYPMIARRLNGEGTPSPKGRVWPMQTVRHVIMHPYPRGRVTYGKVEVLSGLEAQIALRNGSGRRHGRNVTRRRPASEWKTSQNEELRIWSEALCARIDARLAENEKLYEEGKANRTALHRAAPRHLLSGGLGICPDCGSRWMVRKRKYVCSARYRRPGSCDNREAWPVAVMDAAVLKELERVVRNHQRLRDEIQAAHFEEQAMNAGVALGEEVERLQGEIRRLVNSIAEGVPASQVAPAVREREAQLARAEGKLATAAASKSGRNSSGHESAERLVASASGEWSGVLRADIATARAFLKRWIGPVSTWNDDRDDAEAAEAWRMASALPDWFPSPLEIVPLEHEASELEDVREARWFCAIHPLDLVFVREFGSPVQDTPAGR
jgi:DNA invertase Pin-like site-specific DNA recombinase